MILNKIDLLALRAIRRRPLPRLRPSGQSAPARHPGVGTPRRWSGRMVRLDSQRGEGLLSIGIFDLSVGDSIGRGDGLDHV